MPDFNISLPEPLKNFIDEQMRSGRYDSVSEYFRELVQKDEGRQAQDKLEALLLEGLHSGASEEVTDEYWARKRSELIDRQQRKR
jgi:antitoxin ParD1/3/4